jgi:tetratricopeptide (TPR) repeat protein
MTDEKESVLLEIEKLKVKQEELKLEQEGEKLKLAQEKSKLENKKLDLERDKEKWNFWAKVITVVVTVVIGTFGVAYINHVFQNRQLKQQKLLNDGQLRQAEMQYLGKFLTYALEDDIEKRLRFAKYFATLTMSSDLQDKWKDYHGELEELIEEETKAKQRLADAQQAGESEKVAEILKEMARLEAKLAALPTDLTPNVNREDLFRYLSSVQIKSVELLQQGKVSTAIALTNKSLQVVKEALKVFPNDADFHALMGYTLKDLYQSSKNLLRNEQRKAYLDHARQFFESALKIDSNNAGAHNGMGNVLFFEGRFDEAIKEHDIALKLTDGNYPAAEHDKQLVIRVKNGEIPFDF